MAYNPNPPYNPSDYGTHGRIDYDALEKSLQDTRDQIASFNSSEGVQSTNADKVISGIANQEQPVYGAGVPVRDSVMKDPSEYRLYTGELPQFAIDSLAGIKEQQNTFNAAMAAMNNIPEEVESKVQVNEEQPNNDKDKEETIEEIVEGLKLPDYNETKKTTTTTEGSYDKGPASWDGRDFDYFLKRAQSVSADVDPDDDEQGTSSFSSIKDLYPEQRLNNEFTYSDPFKADIYNQLSSAGLSNQDMQDAAQSLSYTNVNSQKDIDNMIKAFEKGDLGPKNTTTTTTKNVGMDNAEAAFGKLFTKKDYNAALNYENQDKKYIKNYLQGYMQEGGNVSDKVKNIFGF
jgi:hypothetical protein